jgi:hypothetical protein
VKQETSPDGRSHNAIAVDALQEARGMPPGARRTDALKKAGLLRRAADSQALIVRKKAGPGIIESRQVVPCRRSRPPAQSAGQRHRIALFRSSRHFLSSRLSWLRDIDLAGPESWQSVKAGVGHLN